MPILFLWARGIFLTKGLYATQRSEKGSEKVLGEGFWGRVLGKGSGEGFWGRVLRSGLSMGCTVKKGF